MYTITVLYKGGARISDDHLAEEPMTVDLLYRLRTAGQINDRQLRDYLALLGPIDEVQYLAFQAARTMIVS